MPDSNILLTYTAIVLGFAFMPGPATLFTMARAASSGVRAGVATGLGIALGDVVHTVLAIVGISALVATSATLFNLVKFAGAAWLVWLGIQAIRADKPLALHQNQGVVAPGNAFRQAILTEVLNPKTALFFLAFLPQFVEPANGLVATQLAILGLIYLLAGLVSTISCALAAGRLGQWAQQRLANNRWPNRVTGCIFCALGLGLALQQR